MQIAPAIMASFSDSKTRALMRVMLSEGLHTSEVSEAVFQGGSQKLLACMYRYLDGLMAQGTIQRIDLGAALHCFFMGPFAAPIINDYLLNIPDERAPDSQIMMDTAGMIFLHGRDYNEG